MTARLVLLSNEATRIPLQKLPRSVNWRGVNERLFRLRLAGHLEVKRLKFNPS